MLSNEKVPRSNPYFQASDIWPLTSVLLSSALILLTALTSCAGEPVRRDVMGDQYEVNGRRYRVLGSSKGYVQRGMASWYGPKFHGRLTASGEVYDMEGMTGAHRTLPMGTYVRVKRIDGKGGVVVKINDRGPFVRGRIIDLSRAAARQLNMLDTGVAEVEITALGERAGGSPGGETVLRARPDYAAGSFSVQVGAFTVKDNARRLAAAMKDRYGSADISLYDRGDTIFYRVRVGRFRTEEAAERFRDDLLRKGAFEEAYVVSR